jgi:hypothetical protein
VFFFGLLDQRLPEIENTGRVDVLTCINALTLRQIPSNGECPAAANGPRRQRKSDKDGIGDSFE